jgi:CRP-like cAMP-binding protein
MPDSALLRTSRELFLSAMAGDDAQVSAVALDLLASALEEDELSAGGTLFGSGEPAEMVYFMRDGRAKVTLDSGKYWIVEGRWAFGGLEALLERPFVRTAVALTDLHLLKLRADIWLDVLENHFDLARAVLRNVSRSVLRLELRKWALQPRPTATPMTVPPTSPSPLQFMDRLATISDLPLFRHAGVQVLADVAGLMNEVVFAPGESLIALNEAFDKTFLLIEGEVTAHCVDPELTVVYGPGTGVCGLAALGGNLGAWEARATTKTRALTLSVEDWFDLMEEHFDLLRSAFAALVELRDSILEHLASQGIELVFQ